MHDQTHSWQEAPSKCAPPAPTRLPSLREVRSTFIVRAIEEDVLCKVLGIGGDADDLWDGFIRTSSVFAHLVSALCEAASDQHAESRQGQSHEGIRLVESALLEIFPDLGNEAAEISSAAFHHSARSAKAIERLRARGALDEFVSSDVGGRWQGASLGFLWGLFAIECISRWPNQFSDTDKEFAVDLFCLGARDSAAYVRGYELSLDEREDNDQTDSAPMSDEIALLEADAHRDSLDTLKALGA